MPKSKGKKLSAKAQRVTKAVTTFKWGLMRRDGSRFRHDVLGGTRAKTIKQLRGGPYLRSITRGKSVDGKVVKQAMVYTENRLPAGLGRWLRREITDKSILRCFDTMMLPGTGSTPSTGASSISLSTGEASQGVSAASSHATSTKSAVSSSSNVTSAKCVSPASSHSLSTSTDAAVTPSSSSSSLSSSPAASAVGSTVRQIYDAAPSLAVKAFLRNAFIVDTSCSATSCYKSVRRRAMRNMTERASENQSNSTSGGTIHSMNGANMNAIYGNRMNGPYGPSGSAVNGHHMSGPTSGEHTQSTFDDEAELDSELGDHEWSELAAELEDDLRDFDFDEYMKK